MLFIVSEDTVVANEYHFIDFLENLFIAYKQGDHLLYITPKTLLLIKTMYTAVLDTNSILKSRILYYEHNDMMEIKILLNLLDIAIEVIPNSIPESIVIISGKEIRKIHLDKFISSASFQKTLLLCEHEVDATIYSKMGDFIINTKNINNKLKIKCRGRTGGGNTIAGGFITITQSNDDICLCLVDSDKKHPTDKLGTTADKIRGDTRRASLPAVTKTNYYIFEEFHELENILPLQFYEDKYSPDINKINTVNLLKKLQHQHLMFFDIKEGINHYSIQTIPFWNHIQTICSNFDVTKTSCTNTSICTSKNVCSYIVVPSMGTNILDDFIQWGDHKSWGVLKDLSTEVHHIWMIIGQMVFSWCCGRDRLIIS